LFAICGEKGVFVIFKILLSLDRAWILV